MPFHKCSCGRWTNYATTCIKCSRSPFDWEQLQEEEPDPYYDEYGAGYDYPLDELDYDDEDDD